MHTGLEESAEAREIELGKEVLSFVPFEGVRVGEAGNGVESREPALPGTAGKRLQEVSYGHHEDIGGGHDWPPAEEDAVDPIVGIGFCLGLMGCT